MQTIQTPKLTKWSMTGGLPMMRFDDLDDNGKAMNSVIDTEPFQIKTTKILNTIDKWRRVEDKLQEPVLDGTKHGDLAGIATSMLMTSNNQIITDSSIIYLKLYAWEYNPDDPNNTQERKDQRIKLEEQYDSWYDETVIRWHELRSQHKFINFALQENNRYNSYFKDHMHDYGKVFDIIPVSDEKWNEYIIKLMNKAKIELQKDVKDNGMIDIFDKESQTWMRIPKELKEAFTN